MLNWFPFNINDTNFLNAWQDVEPNFQGNQPIDKSWVIDTYSVHLGKNVNDLFSYIVDLLMRYQLYPTHILSFTAEFVMENRQVRLGDRIIQRTHIIPGLLDTVTMTWVSGLIFEKNRKGFTYITTRNHYMMGEWTAVVSLHANGDVLFMMNALSKPGPRMPFLGKLFYRRIQQRAHRGAILRFQNSALDHINS